MARCEIACGTLLLLSFATNAAAQTDAEVRENQVVGQSLNYVFATDLGSGLYDLDGRSLQIYRFTYDKELRGNENQPGVRFVLPLTFGFFDFDPLDVFFEGIPSRVDSASIVPGLELDYPLPRDWHLVPYARAGATVASSHVDGWLYGLGVRIERRQEWHGWNTFSRSEINVSGVSYRQDLPDDQFARLRQGLHLTRGVGWTIRQHEVEAGLYGIVDIILDPPTAPVADARKEPLQAEFGITFNTRPAFRIWRWDAPRLGIGYRLAGDLSAWRLLIGAPF